MFSSKITIMGVPAWTNAYPVCSLPPEEGLPSKQGCGKAYCHCPSSQCFICVTLNPNLIKKLQRPSKSQYTWASGRTAPFTCVTARRYCCKRHLLQQSHLILTNKLHFAFLNLTKITQLPTYYQSLNKCLASLQPSLLWYYY